MSMILLLALSAEAAEVVWLDATPHADLPRLAEQVGATRPPLDPLSLRAAATDPGPADAAAWEALRAALRDVRTWETRLDGELIIMRDLARPIAGVTLLRSEAERGELFTALAYQGFAVDRFFVDTLATDTRAAPYRFTSPDGPVWPAPWVDAVALEPERQPSPYEIAEAPQRARYADDREAVRSLLPALLVVDAPLPAGAALWIDGRPTALDASGQVRLAPGRHLIHVALGEHVLSRADLRAAPAAAITLPAPLSDAAWTAWLDAVRSGEEGAPPAELGPQLTALGGEVVLAWQDDRGRLRAARVTPSGVTEEQLARPEPEGRGVAVQAAVAVGGGWMSSGDFYLQDPVDVPHNKAAVNAGALDVVVEVAAQQGLFRGSLILDTAVPLGQDHVALVGDRPMRARPDLSAAVGLPWVQVTGGFLFPYHPSVGLRATAPLGAGVELVATGRAGLPASFERDDGTTWTGRATWQAWLGVGWRFNSR